MNRESFTEIVDSSKLSFFQEGEGSGENASDGSWSALFVVCRHVSFGGFGAS